MPRPKLSLPLVRSTALHLSLLGLTLLVGTAARAQTTSYNFDSGNTDFQANFNRTSHYNVTSWGYLPSGGIGGSGAVLPAGAYDSDAVFLQALPNTPGTTITLSVYGKFDNLRSIGTTNGNSGEGFGIGLVSSTSSYAGDGGNNPGSSSLLSFLTRYNSDNGTTATPSGINLSTAAFQGSTLTGGFGNNNSNAIVAGDWYRITDTITVQSGTLQISSIIADYGASGTSSTPTTLISETGTATNPFTGNTFYAAIYGGTGGGNGSGANALDNFSQIAASSAPEPAALALLLPAALPLLAAGARRSGSRRRRSAAS